MATLAPSQQDLAKFFGHTDPCAQVSDIGEEDIRLIPFSVEILDKIFEYSYYLDNPLKKYVNRTANFANLSQVNSVFYFLSLKYRYRYCKFIRSNMFYRFLLTLMADGDPIDPRDGLGQLVYTLDFQEFTSVGLGRSGEMMSEIQDLTERTILQCLKLTPNLQQFLSSESIESDVSTDVVDYLFNSLPKLECLDFCGSSGLKFATCFENLQSVAPNYTLERLSFHDCTDLGPGVFRKIIPNLHGLKRLDLTHTRVSARDLSHCLNADCRLTHLSLSKCSNIGATHELISLLINHQAINHEGLVWLNLQNEYSVAILKAATITYLLQNLNCYNLKYLNLNDYNEVSQSHLDIIVRKFPHLESLSLSHLQRGSDLSLLKHLQGLKYIDLSSYMFSKGDLDNLLNSAPESLQAAEVALQMSENLPDVFTVNGKVWRCHNASGQSRRLWVHRVESYDDAQLYDNFYDNKVFFNIATGEKYDGEFKKPLFLKYASRKVNCSKLLVNEPDEDIFPNMMCERGFYRYYSLHK
ncbi:DEKNAAC105670 [Brettanomyces naardenensis]|uniref:DEKNAAC105670 n=1 Tax=Brettanomyces naardenensis TaxID=13370 RepID=A0A448YU27_BRENA|nr:DEKNAAC105670 [Brettanomyces naardenensis]